MPVESNDGGWSRRKRGKRGGRRRRSEGMAGTGGRATNIQLQLLDVIEDARVTGLPQLATLVGETGRGKTFALQALYDQLSRQSPGYWLPGLTPRWPPLSSSELRAQRKRITPPDSLRQPGAPASFLWLAVGCSGYADAPRLDPTADLLRQLRKTLSDISDSDMAATTRGDWVAKVVAKGAVEGLGQAVPLVGPLKLALETMARAPVALSRQRATAAAVERRRAFEAVREYARLVDVLGRPLPTLVLVIDDATGAPADLFAAAGALIAEAPELPQDPSDAPVRFLPEVLEDMPPLPIVLLVTAWDHALAPTDADTPLAQWLREYDSLGLQSRRIACRALRPPEAANLLNEWDFGPDVDLRSAIVDHIVRDDPKRLVNQLVLAEHVAWVETQRDPFTGELAVVSADIAGLSTSPEHHIEERLEALRVSEDGRVALALLAALCGLAIDLPWGLVEAMLAESDSSMSPDILRERFVGLGVVSGLPPHGTPDPLNTFIVDADLYEYLRKKALTPSAADLLERSCASFFRRWIEVLERDSLLRGIFESWNARALRLSDCARLGVAHMGRSADAVTRLAGALASDAPVPATSSPLTGSRAALALWWLQTGGAAPVATGDILRGCSSLGASRPGLTCLCAVARQDDIANHRAALDAALATLAEHSALFAVQHALVDVLIAIGDLDHAITVVSPKDLNPNTAVQLANALARADRLVDAITLASANRNQDAGVRLCHARLVAMHAGPEAACRVLEGHLDRWTVVARYCDLLIDAGKDQERTTVLEDWASRHPMASCTLASEHTLQGDVKAARELLTPWIQGNAEAAVQLAHIEWQEENYLAWLATLSPFAISRSPVIASAVASALDDVGSNGLRFHAEKHSVIPGAPSAGLPPTAPRRDYVPRAARLKRPTGARSPARLISDISEALRQGAAPSGVADDLVKSDGQTPGWLRYVGEVLRRDLATSHDAQMSAVAFHLLRRIVHPTEGQACSIADLAFAGRIEGASLIAWRVLTSHAGSNPAVDGRIAALAAAAGDARSELHAIAHLAGSDRKWALVAVIRMLGPAPKTEICAWAGLCSAATDSLQFMANTIRQYAASRMLAVSRALGSSAPPARTLLAELMPSVPDSELIRLLEGTLYAYARNPAKGTPPLYPYQAVSLCAALRATGRANGRLEEMLYDALLAAMRGTPERQEAFAAWAPHSPIAARVVAALALESSAPESESAAESP